MDINISLHIDLGLVGSIISILITTTLVVLTGLVLRWLDRTARGTYHRGEGLLFFNSYYTGSDETLWLRVIAAWLPVAFWLWLTLFPPDFWTSGNWRTVFSPFYNGLPVLPQIWSQYGWQVLLPGALAIHLIVPFIVYGIGYTVFGWIERFTRRSRSGSNKRTFEVYFGMMCLCISFYLAEGYLLLDAGTYLLGLATGVALQGVFFCFFGLPRWHWPWRKSATNGSTN